MAHVNVRELIKRYEDLIADESTKTWVSKPFKMEDVQPVTMRSLSDVSVHYPDVVEPAPGEPHRGVDAVEISSDVPQDVVGTVGESDNETYKLEYLPVSQSIEKHQWIHQSNSGCFNLMVRRLNHIFSLRRPSKQIMQLDKQ